MRTLKLSRLERALVRKLYIRRYTAATLMRMFRCCQTTVNRAVRNHMSDNTDDDDAIIRNADIPADVAAMLGLMKECDEESRVSTTASRWRPWAPTRGVIPRMPVPRSLPRTVARRSPKLEATGSDSNLLTVAAAKQDVRHAPNSPGIPRCNVTQAGSAMPTREKPAPDGLAASVEGFLASIQLGEDHAQMLLDEGIKTHQDLLHIKEIIGTESLRFIKDSLKARGFTTFELIKFISAVKGIPA